MTTPKLLGISGSLRKDAYNTRLLNAAVRSFGDCNYSSATLRMPLYDGDLELAKGIPEQAKKLHAQMEAADVIIIATPEYNGNLPGVLKNALDWVSREKPMPMENKPVAIISAAAGRAGGVMAQNSMRQCLTAFQPDLLQGPSLTVAAAYEAFDEDGNLKGEQYQTTLDALMVKLRGRL